MRRERREPDRPLKRMRQLQSRLDALLRDARELRSESVEQTKSITDMAARLRQRKRAADADRQRSSKSTPNTRR